jgi:hypothetical protein
MAIRWEEKRISPRIRLRAPLRYHILGTREFANAVSNDISTKGLSFINNRFIAPKISLALEIQLLSRLMRATGKVAWANPLAHSDKYRLGVEFLELGKEDQVFLNDFIDMHTGRF